MAWALMRVARPDYGGVQLVLTRDPGNPRAPTVTLYVHPRLAQQFGDIDPANIPQAVRDWIQGHLDTQDAADAFEVKFSTALANFREAAAGKLAAQAEIVRQYLVDNPAVTGAQLRAVLAPRAQAVYDAIDALTGAV